MPCANCPGLPRRDLLLGAGGAVALHVLGAWMLLPQPTTRQPPAPVTVLEANLLSAPPVPAAAPAAPAAPPIPVAPSSRAVQPAVTARRPAQARPAPAKAPTPKPALPQPRRPRAVDEPVVDPPVATPSTVLPVAASPAATPAAPAQPRPARSDVAAEPPVTAPRFDAAYLNNPAPTYPPLSRRLGEQGRVLMRVFVNPNGAPDQVQLRQSSGYRRLDAAAEAAVRGWRFVPARRGDEPIGAWVLVPIAFNLRS